MSKVQTTVTARLIGSSLSPYIIRELIGIGGVAEVYRAQHLDLSRECAIKVMRAERAEEKEKVKAFNLEYEVLHRLSHPGIPAAQRQGEIDGRPCFQMDLIAGETLSSLVTQGATIPGPSVLQEITGIVAYLHEKKIVHNDLKLENMILRPDGGVTLIDFGNVREIKDGVITRFFTKNKVDQIFGTVTYLAPELLNGKKPTPQSDIYALGICAFLLLTGQPPFTVTRPSGRFRVHHEGKMPSIRERLPQLPSVISAGIDACLSKVPEQRPADAGTLLGILKHWHNRSPSSRAVQPVTNRLPRA
jgi:serine/threonine protein kinase